jgi:zinc transport system substrate-binding protein
VAPCNALGSIADIITTAARVNDLRGISRDTLPQIEHSLQAGTVMRSLGILLAVAALICATPAAAAPDELNVVVTIKPIHSLVTRLMEGVGTPTLLIKGAGSPHTFALKPSDVRAINAADVFVRVSDTLEPFTRAIVKSLPGNVEVVTLAQAPGVTLLDRREGGTFDAHAHAEVHAEGGKDDADDDDAGGKDGHIWLDPDNAKAIVRYLAEVLRRRAPAQAAKIEANAAKLNADLDGLEAEIAAETASLKGKPFVVFHDAYQYFERRFDLDAVGSITVSPELQPSAKRLTELRHKIAALGAVCVFAEPWFQPNLIDAVTEGSHARSGTLDPEGSTLNPGAALYFELMRNLASGFKSCLEQPS